MASIVRFVLGYFKRLRFYHNLFVKRPSVRFAYYIYGNLKKYTLGLGMLIAVLPKLVKTASVARKDFLLMRRLIAHDLYLQPTHVFYPNTAKILLTKACNFNCSYCYRNRGNQAIPFEDLRPIFKQLHNVQIKHAGIVGGEAFMDMKRLLAAIEIAQQEHVTIETITTNGYKFADLNERIATLKKLKKAGFTGNITISVGPEHQRQIHPNVFKGVADASRKIFGRNIFKFNLETGSYEEYRREKTRLKQLLGDYYTFTFIGIIDASRKERPSSMDLSWTYCCGYGLSVSGKEDFFFCQNIADEYEAYRLQLQIPFTDKAYLGLEHKMLDIVNQASFNDIRAVLRKSGEFNEQWFFPCDTCLALSQNKNMQNTIHKQFVRK